MLHYPQVALDFMNRDHADFASLREQLLGLLATQAPADKVDNLLDEMLTHTRDHFAEEERLMQEHRFPPFPVHKGEHDNVLAEMAGKTAGWKTTRDAAALRDWLDRRMGDWFVNHVSTMDLVTARFVASQQPTR